MIAHLKRGEPVNTGCLINAKEQQEMVVNN